LAGIPVFFSGGQTVVQPGDLTSYGRWPFSTAPRGVSHATHVLRDGGENV
jgi:hypothetical protein